MTFATREHKVLPFPSPKGVVPGHAVIVHAFHGRDGRASFPRRVLFWTFDQEAGCPVELGVDVGDFTRFVHRTNRAHSVQAVILDDGTRVAATGRICSYGGNDRLYNEAPLLARGLFGANTLMRAYPLLEVAGVHDYLGSFGMWGNKQPDPSLILNPWERDNAIHSARLSQVLA